MKLSRRKALQSMGLGVLSLNIPVWAQAQMIQGLPRLSGVSLKDPDANGLMLPRGFSSRIVARTGQKVSGTNYTWHYSPDGGAVLPTEDGGWIYVSNSESVWSFRNSKGGGVGAIRFDSAGNIVDAYRLLSKTIANCAGGLTPWGTWLSCEEFDLTGKSLPEYFPKSRTYKAGLVWETFPLEPGREAVAHPAMGAFQHEAAAYDEQGRFYLTEDKKDGLFYRYLPEAEGDLSRGVLQAAKVDDNGIVEWMDVPDPEVKNGRPTRFQVEGATPFRGGEGAAWHDGRIYFTTKHDNRVWFYEVSENRIDVLYDAGKSENPVLTGVDNVAITPAGQVVVAEDGGNMELVGVDAQGRAIPILRIPGHTKSEITGPAFSPDGERLYLSSQRGVGGKDSTGITYEIQGPFQELII